MQIHLRACGTTSITRRKMWLGVGILLIGWFFIIHAGTQNKRFHPDEALYTTFARHAAVHGDWLLTSPLDKPPLSIYANALSQALFGTIITEKGVYDLPIRVGEFVARIPNLLAGMMTIVLLIALEKKLSPHTTPLSAIALIGAPLFIQLSASAFTDGLMLMWIMASWLAIERRRPFWSGLLLMLGFATKPQAIFILPLLVVRGVWGKSIQTWRRFLVGMSLPFITLLMWDASRGATSIFALGQHNYPTTGWVHHPTDWLSRGWQWGEFIFLGANPLLVIGVLVVGLIHSGSLRRTHMMNWTMMAFVGLYSLCHIVLGIPLYDRYALIIIPFISLIASQHLKYGVVIGLLAFVMTIPIGRDGYPLDQEGAIIDLAQAINDLPFAAVVYDHWRGWELGYYLGAWSEKRRVYYPDPVTQAVDSLNNPEKWTRYLVAPVDVDYDVWLDAMRDVGYTVYIQQKLAHYIIFALDPPHRQQSPFESAPSTCSSLDTSNASLGKSAVGVSG